MLNVNSSVIEEVLGYNHDYKFNNVNTLFTALVKLLLEQGDKVEPRGISTYEKRDVVFTLYATDNGVDRFIDPIIKIKGRRLNPYFLAAEALWILSGKEDRSFLARFMRSITKFYDYGNTFGAYGPRFVRDFDYVVNTLKQDPMSRRAIISLWRPEVHENGNMINTIDVPCTLHHQYFIRNNKLHLSYSMRSNDVFKGLSYDISNFVFMGQMIAKNLDCQLESITGHIGSLHLYESDIVAGLDKMVFDDYENYTNSRLRNPFYGTYLTEFTPRLVQHDLLEIFNRHMHNNPTLPDCVIHCKDLKYLYYLIMSKLFLNKDLFETKLADTGYDFILNDYHGKS